MLNVGVNCSMIYEGTYGTIQNRKARELMLSAMKEVIELPI